MSSLRLGFCSSIKRAVAVALTVCATLALDCQAAGPGFWQAIYSGKFVKTGDPSVGGTEVSAAGLTFAGNTYTYGGTKYTVGDNKTAAYVTYMKMTAGKTYRFVKNYDDNGKIVISGPCAGTSTGTQYSILDNSTWNSTAYGSFVPTESGWYRLDLRVGNGTNGVGPTTDFFKTTIRAGLAWTDSDEVKSNVCNADNAAYWHRFENVDGESPLFYSSVAQGVLITSVPAEYGNPSPALGLQTITEGEPFVARVDAAWTNAEKTVIATCTGWKLYDIDDNLLDSGDQNVCTLTGLTAEDYRHIEWQWVCDYLVTAAADAESATVTNPGGWVRAGATFSTTVQPDASDTGHAFDRWVDQDDATVGNGLSLSLTVTKPMTLKAVFSGCYYVATDGSDENAGTSPEAPLLTIEAAVAKASSDAKTVIKVAPGTYVATGTEKNADDVIYIMLLDKPVQVIATEGPENTVIDASTTTARAYAKLTHKDALISGFTFKNGGQVSKDRATGIQGSAGLVTNCVISVRNQWAHSGWILNASGTLRASDIVVAPMNMSVGETGYACYLKENAQVNRLVITNIVLVGTPQPLLQLDGSAKATDVLVAGNRFGSTPASTMNPFVRLNGDGVVLTDATIANNEIRANNGALHIAKNKATATGCIVWGNTSTGTHPDIQGAANLAQVSRSCCSELTPSEQTGNIAIDPQFVDMTGGDYHLRAVSQAKEMGATWLRPSGTATELQCAGDADNYVSASGEPLVATFTGYAVGASGDVTASWDFGDGTTSTDWPTATHTYELTGAYTVTLTVSDGTTMATYVFPTKLVATPATCYVKEGNEGVYPYDTWEKATPSLADAYAVGSRAIIVTNGMYDIAAPLLMISRPLSLTSVEGPTKTTLNSLGKTTCDHRHLTVSGSDDIFISGFTFIDGYASGYGWTAVIEMSSGTLSNCVIRSTRRVSRSAANYFFGTAKVVDCLFDGYGMGWSNDANIQSGVRVEGNAVLDRCEIKGYRIDNNTESSGYDGESPVRIASSGAIVRNCLIHHCTNGVSSAEKNRGPVALLSGRIENCTIIDNYCGGYGGGVWATGGTIVNSIICNNTALMGGNDLWSTTATPTIRYSSASDFSKWVAGAGEGCTTKAPIFDSTNAYHLTALSTAQLNKGLSSEALGDFDLDRQVRIFGDAVDMGCYEFAGSTDIPLDGTVAVVGAANGRLPYTGVFELSPVGNTNGLTVVWDFGTGEPVAGGLIVTNTFTVAGSYTVSASFSNEKQEEKTAAIAEPVLAVPQVCYVSAEGSNTSPYDTWETAANEIMTAVALNPKTVLVTNGTYKVSGDGVMLSTDLELRSVNGPDVTFIDAQNTCRNVWLTGEGAVCDGFSLIRGTGDWDTKSLFARVQAGTLSHCILTNGNSGNYRDSAVLVKDTGRMVDCVVDTANMGGNADSTHFWGTVVQSGGIIERCTIQRYNYTNQGGAGSTHFAVHVEGTGIFRNCLVRDCISTQSAKDSTVYRGAVGVTGNGVVENCTIVNSKSCQQGGAITIMSTAKDSPTVRNNVCWNSTLKDGTAADDVRDLNAAVPRVSYSRANNLTDGEDGNLTADPCLSTRKSRPRYSLGSSSPCINVGQRLDWMTEDATDIRGMPRWRGPEPDMGCYECEPSGFRLIVR